MRRDLVLVLGRAGRASAWKFFLNCTWNTATPHSPTPALLSGRPPTPGGEVLLGHGIKEAYQTGSGSIILRAKVTIEDSGGSGGAGGARRRKRGASAVGEGEEGPAAGGGGGGRQLIVVTEVPYQVNKVGVCVWWGVRAERGLCAAD